VVFFSSCCGTGSEAAVVVTKKTDNWHWQTQNGPAIKPAHDRVFRLYDIADHRIDVSIKHQH
jgi:hypothetical protein